MINENTYWDVLTINSDSHERELAVAFLENYHCGVHDKKDSSDVFFINPDKLFIEKILKEKLDSTNWIWSKIEKENWIESWKPFFKNISIKNKVEISPPWKIINEQENKISIKIEPGMAFGTGHHETTFMMIESILKYVNKSTSVLDVGCGSGILSILSQKLKAKKVFAVDNDSDVVENFNYNLDLNNSSVKLEIMNCLDIKDFNYNVILANINKHILLDLIPLIYSKAIIIISGILIDDIKDFKEILSKYKIIETIKKNEWACLVIQIK